MLMPPISRYMTSQPWTIRPDAPLAQARQIMRDHKVRHLPVLEGGKLVGVVSERDLYLFGRLGDPELTVEDAMTVDVYVAHPEDPVEPIVERMADRKYGSVVVLDRRGVVEGIFTSVDGLQMLADVLRRTSA